MKKFVIGLIIGAIIGISCTLLVWEVLCLNDLDPTQKYGRAELIYYMSQPLVVIGTFSAVIVALFGNEIKNAIFSPKCRVRVEGDGFAEDLGETINNINPQAQFYKLNVFLENIGVKELNELQLVIKKAEYSQDHNKFRTVSHGESVIFWRQPEIKSINLRTSESRDIILARVVPEASLGTPDASQKSPLRFSITGINLDPKYSKKGYWRVRYDIQTPHRIINSFVITYSWSGKWFNRLTEMTNELGYEFKYIKK